MPHYTCESCGKRLYSAARPENLIDPSCPACGVLHAKDELTEVMIVAPMPVEVS